MHIIQIDWTKYVLQVEDVLPGYLVRPVPNVLVILPPPQLWAVVLLVEHRLHEEGVEEVRPSPPRLLCAELLIAPCEAVVQEVVYDLVAQPLAGAQGLHAPALDGVSSLVDKDL